MQLIIQEISSGARPTVVLQQLGAGSCTNPVALSESHALVAELSGGDVAPEEVFWNAIKERLQHHPRSGFGTSALLGFEGCPAAKPTPL